MFIEAVEQYTQLGLRTLCLACRELNEDEYQEWSFLFKEASSTLVDREVNFPSQYGSLCVCRLIYVYVYKWLCIY